MAIEQNFETIRVNEKKGVAQGQIKAECRTDVPTEQVSKVLSVCAIPTVATGECQNGQIKYNGKVVFHIIYTDVNGNLTKCECGAEYAGAIPFEKEVEDSAVFVNVKAEKTESDISGARLAVTAYLTATAEIKGNETVKMFTGGEGFVIDRKELPYVKSYGVKKGVYPIEEEFDLNYSVAQVLSHKTRAKITAVQCGVGCIIVDGEVYLSALLLQNIEKSDIIREEKTFPFRMEIEYDEAMPAMTALARVGEKSFKTDITVDGDDNKSKVLMSVTLCFEGEAFTRETVTAATDVFSLTTQTQTERDCKELLIPQGMRICPKRVGGRANNTELSAGTRLMCVGGEEIEITSSKKDGDCLTVTGIASVTGYLKDTDGVISSVTWQTPFETQLDCALKDGDDYEITAFAEKPSARIISLTEADIEIDAVFSVTVYEKQCIGYVKGVTCGEQKSEQTCAISVYIPTAGEDLWSLAKRLNVCPDDLVSANKDLQFPLTGEERIVIYRQK